MYNAEKFPEVNISKTQQLNLLFKTWQEKYPDQKFAEDGIRDEELWDKADRKLLFLFKETNNYDQDIRVGANETTWWEIQPWVYGLMKTTISDIPLFTQAKKSSRNPNLVDYTAIMNLKKIPGKSYAEMAEVKHFAEKDKELIIRELNVIQPQIVICGGTFDICSEIFSDWRFQSVGPDERCFIMNDIIWIKFCHYGVHFYRDMLYYALTHFFQNALNDPGVAQLLF